MLRTQGLQALFGVSGADLAHRHTALTDMWGAGVDGLRERLTTASDLAGLLTVFESALIERLRHPAVTARQGRGSMLLVLPTPRDELFAVA